jgi:16S rRNA U516 pseudouridylate synthase RsuA-like enzyme
VRIGELRLGSLKPKEWRYLTSQEVIALQKPAPIQGRKTSRSKLKTGR